MSDERVNVRFSTAEYRHLLYLLKDAELLGQYYGPKDEYWKRHKRIKAKIQQLYPGEKTP